MGNTHLFEVSGEVWIVTESATYKLDEHLKAADEIAALEAQNASLRAMLRELQWCRELGDERGHMVDGCPACLRLSFDGHATDCELAALLAQAGGPAP